MIKVTVGNNVKRESVLVAPDTTLREALERGSVDYNGGALHLDGASVNPGDMNKTFAELGYDGTDGHDRAFLLNIAKTDNA